MITCLKVQASRSASYCHCPASRMRRDLAAIPITVTEQNGFVFLIQRESDY